MSTSPTSIHPTQRRENNFDFMRVVLAALVIVSHSANLLDGNDSREPLGWLSRGQLDFGGVAVDGFFILSGFLILQSWLSTRNLGNYLLKRGLRIYPGFIVAILLSVFVAGALGAVSAGAYWRGFDLHNLIYLAKRTLTLRLPHTPATFAHLHYHDVNGAIWTIRYEFVCYLGVALLGLCGAFRKRSMVLLLAGLAISAYAAQNWFGVRFGDTDFPVIGVPSNWPRLATYFLVGMCFCLYRDTWRFERKAMLVCVGVVIASLFIPHFAWFAFPIYGAYGFFYFAFSPAVPLHNFARHGDFSYGIFLYGWPVAQLLILWLGGGINPWLLTLLTLAGAVVLAFISWHLVEKPCLSLKPRRKAGIAGAGGKPVFTA